MNLNIVALRIPEHEYVEFRVALMDIIARFGVEKVADQASGEVLSVGAALAALAARHKETA